MKNKQTIFAVGLVTLLVSLALMMSLSSCEFVRFVRYQEHVSSLKGIGMAISEYHDAHHVWPVDGDDDLWNGGWRRRLYESESMRGAYGSDERWQQVLERYAFLIPKDSPWLEGKTQTYKELRERYGEPVVVIQLPKSLLDRHCSALILDSDRKRLRLRDGEEFSLTILRDMIGLRRDGSTSLIPSDADVESILKILQKDDRF